MIRYIKRVNCIIQHFLNLVLMQVNCKIMKMHFFFKYFKYSVLDNELIK